MNKAEIALTAQNILDLEATVEEKKAVLDVDAFSGAVFDARQDLVTLQVSFPDNTELQLL